ncbi:hypothetical protein CIK05_09900 [Bdellovibrio sp. qaytius]|nr:hypothetical protein CIK05_09900 [Bdellovibrio sp. qaytius]
MRAIHFLVTFSLIFNSHFSFAAETVGGGKSSTSANTKKSASTYAQPSVQLKKGTCPTPLKESVLDDYKDKSTLMVFKFNSEAKTCNTSVSAYQNYMSGKGVQTSYQTPDALSAELSKQFATTISPNMSRTLDGCNSSPDLTPEQAKVAQTRFYAAATRVEKFNKSAVDELAFIDSITEGSAVLEGVECTPLMPDLKKNCENLRAEGSKCKGETAQRFEEQVQKTMDNIAKIEALKDAKDKCEMASMVKCAGGTQDCPMRGGFTKTSKLAAEKKCENIGKAIEILKDEVPWIRGEIFDKIAREKAKPRSLVRNYLSRDKIKEGMRDQLKANRTALATAYKDNLQNFRCLIYDTSDKGEKCDFAKVRTELAKLDSPTVPQLQDRRANMEFKTYFDAESCLLDRGEDRASTKTIVDNSAVDAGLTIVTAGLGSVAVGAKVIGGLSKTAIAARRGAFAGSVAVDAYFAQGSSREAFKSCTQKTTSVLDSLSVQQKQKNMVCDNAKSQVSVARETNSSCMVDTLLAGADLLPFMGAAAPLLARSLKSVAPVAAPEAKAAAEAIASGAKADAKVVAKVEKAEKVAAVEKPKVKENVAAKVVEKPVAKIKAKISEGPVSADDTKPKATEEIPTLSADKSSDSPKTETIEPVVVTAKRIGAEETSTAAHELEAAKPSSNLTTAQNDLMKTFTSPTKNAKKETAEVATNHSLTNKLNTEQMSTGVSGKPAQLQIDGEVVKGNAVAVHDTANGKMVEVAYQNPNGSMSSRKILAQEFFQTNPKIKEQLDNQFYSLLSGGRKMGSDRAPQTTVATQTFEAAPKSAALDMRSGNSTNSAMAVAAAPSRQADAIQAPIYQAAAVQRNQVVNIQPEAQNFGSAGPVASVERSSSRAPASQGYATPQAQSSQLAEDELVQALNRSNVGAAAPAVTFGKVKADPVSVFKTSSADGSQARASSKVDNTPTTYVDKTDNVRFVEGEQIKVSNFDGGKDAEFKVVQKLDNGLLRVSDSSGKEFDLLREEVKTAERLNLNAGNAPSAVAATGSAKIKTWTNEIVEQVKVKDEFIRPGDKVNVKNFEGGSDLNANVVRKNTDGTVRVKDEAGKEFDLVKTEVKDAEFTRGLTAEVKQNLEIGDEVGRIKAAEGYLQKPLTEAQQQAVLKSHKIAEEKDIFALSKTDLRQKTKVLRDAGLSEDEASLLLRKGVTGSTGIDNVRIVSEQPRGANPMINVPVVGKDVSYPGKVISGPNAKGQFEVEIFPPGKPATVVRIDGTELKKANTPQALRQAQIREARRSSFADRSSAELEQILDDSLRQSELHGGRDKKIDIEGQRALEELAKRQNKDVNALYEEAKLARKSTPDAFAAQKAAIKTEDGISQADAFNSSQAGGARNELDYLAERDGLKGTRLNSKQRENIARELGVTDDNRIAGMDYQAVAARKETRELFEKVFPGKKEFDPEMLRQSMSFNPRGGYIGNAEFANAEKFVEAAKKADLSGAKLSLAERRLLNKYTDRAPLYARQSNPDVALLPRQNVEVNTSAKTYISEFNAPKEKVIDPIEVAGDARNKLDYLAQQDRLNGSRFNERQRQSAARELGIYSEDKTAALDYGTVATKKEASELFEKIFPGQKEFDPEMLRQSMSFNPRGGYIGNAEFANAEKFVNAVKKAEVDGSTLSLSERRILNKFTDRAPLYARQVNPETATITRQSLEAVVPPRITNTKVSTFAARGDEVVAQVNIKPEVARAGDQVLVKDFKAVEGATPTDLNAKFVRKNSDGTIRVKDSDGKEFNLDAQATADSKYYRGLTAELKVNGSLDNPARVKAAEEYVKRPLSDVQKKAVISSHNVGGEGRGYFDYTAKELKEKTQILRKSGFSNTEATLLVRKGITGNSPIEISNLIKVTPSDVRVGDQIIIREFNGTGELKGQIVGPANNGGLLVREANGTETILYKSDIEDLANSQITRNPNSRMIAAAEDLSLERTPIVKVAPKQSVSIEPKDLRAGDKVIINNFDGTGELEGVILGPKKTGGFLLREVSGREFTVYKTDLEEVGNAKITRTSGEKIPKAKNESVLAIDNAPDSALLVSKDKKMNPDIAVPLGNGELRQGRVISQVEAKPGLAKAYVVEYIDEVGVTSQVHLTQDELLAANTAEALKKVKADRARSLQYQSKSDQELHQMLDEGNRAAKDAVGKGRSVDKPDLSAETQSALSELARRNAVTSNAVFEAYRRGGVKGLENLAQAQKVIKAAPSTAAVIPDVPIKPLAEVKTGDFVVVAGVGDVIKLPKAVGKETQGLVTYREKVNGEVIYSVAVKVSEQKYSVIKMTDRELGDVNPELVGLKIEKTRGKDIQATIEEDFKNSRKVNELTDLREKSREKIEAKNKVTYDDESHPYLVGRAGAANHDGQIYINLDRDADQRFSTLLHEVSHTKTDVAQGDLSVQSLKNHLTPQGYGSKFSLDEIKAATINFAADKQTVIAQSKAGKPGIANLTVKREIASMQSSVDRRQGFINDARNALDKVDESLATITMTKSDLTKNDHNVSLWHIRLKNVEGKESAPVYISFVTPVNTSRNEAMMQLREYSRAEKLKLLNQQARLDYDKMYLTELRTKVGVPKPAEPLNGPSIFQVAEKGVPRNLASVGVKAQAISDTNKATQTLVEELESVIGIRGRAVGLRNTSELTSSHPLTPVIDKQRQIVNRLNHADRDLQPENFARISTNVANDFVKSGDVDLALPYYKVSAETIENHLGTTAKSFWSNEDNTKAAIKAGFLADNQELAQMATQKSVLAKLKTNDVEEVKKVALDQFHNLGYEYDRILYGVKRYGNKNKELELLVIRKQQQHIAKKYGLTKDLEQSIGKENFEKIDDQADLTVDDLIKNPKQIIDPEKFKKTKRIPAGT